MSQQDDPFHLETGLKDDFTAVIVDAWFGTAENVPDLVLFLKLHDEDGEEMERRYTCGADWQSYDGGKTAEHATKKFFNKNSKLGRLVTAAFDCGAEQMLRSRGQGAGPRSAEIWKGLNFHWYLQTDTGTFNRGDRVGEKWESNTYFPDKYIGEGAATVAAPKMDGAASDPFQGVSTELRDQVINLARSKDFNDWVTAVVQLPGAAQETTLMKAVSTEAFYESLK